MRMCPYSCEQPTLHLWWPGLWFSFWEFVHALLHVKGELAHYVRAWCLAPHYTCKRLGMVLPFRCKGHCSGSERPDRV